MRASEAVGERRRCRAAPGAGRQRADHEVQVPARRAASRSVARRAAGNSRGDVQRVVGCGWSAALARGALMARIASERRKAAQGKKSRGGAVQTRRTAVPSCASISATIRDRLVTCPGLPAPRIRDHLSREASRASYAPGTEFQIARIEMVANTGTYLDSPVSLGGRRRRRASSASRSTAVVATPLARVHAAGDLPGGMQACRCCCAGLERASGLPRAGHPPRGRAASARAGASRGRHRLAQHRRPPPAAARLPLLRWHSIVEH
jgi:hypothetical protein